MDEKEKIEAYSSLFEFFDSLGDNNIYKRIVLEEFFKYILENDLPFDSNDEKLNDG